MTHTPSQPGGLIAQIIAFTGVGVIAAVVHYGLLVGLVELEPGHDHDRSGTGGRDLC